MRFNELSTKSIVASLTQPDGTAFDVATAYPGAVDGDPLNDDAKGSFKFSIHVGNTFTRSGTTYTKGDIALQADGLTPCENIYLSVATVNGVKKAVATIFYGLFGDPGRTATYRLTVYTKKDNVWTAIEWVTLEVLGEPA